jgi:hypothetical protein
MIVGYQPFNDNLKEDRNDNFEEGRNGRGTR